MSVRNEVDSVHIAAQVDTLDEALTWVVQQVDTRNLERPNIAISPIFLYPAIDGDEGQWMYEVSVGASLTPGEATDG
jgi:hypothetical protein